MNKHIMEYQDYYESIVDRGLAQHPRGLCTTAVFDNTFIFIPGTVYKRPGDNLAIGFVELYQFILGTFNKSQIANVAPKARLDLFTGQSAYGPRTVGQFERAIRELQNDPDSRRAVVMIAHPRDTNETIPCTLSMQFMINKYANNLITIVTMRSSDGVWGLPYDIIQFGGIALAIANCVRVNPGIVIVNIGNSHVYYDTELRGKSKFIYYGSFSLPKWWENWENLATWESIKEWADYELQLLLVDPKYFIQTQVSTKEEKDATA
jgi:hypothetical protein